MSHHPQIGWQDTHTATGRAREHEVALEWVDCPWCWAQQAVIVPGSGAQPCPNCLGVGQIARSHNH